MYNTLINNRKDKIFYYSPFNFIRDIKSTILLDLEINKLKSLLDKESYFSITIDEKDFVFIFEKLDWDTSFFKKETYKLINVLFEKKEENNLIKATEEFFKYIKKQKGQYIFIEIPSEDTFLIQALNTAKFKLVETRLTYFNDNIQEYNYDKRYNVRKADFSDIDNLRKIASEMRNEYDRFHADTTFDPIIADSFLSKYIEEAIKGFSDVVIVPNEDNLKSDSFLTANYFENLWEILDKKVSKMVLSAVSSETNRGWYIKLISEMTYLMKNKKVECVFMNTQSTNRQVFRIWEKLGYKLGCTTHILSITLND